MEKERRDAWPVVRKWLRALIALAACGVLLLFLLLNYAPGGTRVRYTISMEPGAESPLKPAYALGQNDYARDFTVAGSRMAGDQVAFHLNVPYQRYEKALVELVYRGDPEELLVRARSGSGGETPSEPANNRLLNGLDWPGVEEGGLMLLEREPAFSSVEGFLDSLEGTDEMGVATYNCFLPPVNAYELAPKEGFSLGDVDLRGPHAALARVTGGGLRLGFSKVEPNRIVGADPLVIRVFDGDECIFTDAIDDDGVGEASCEPSGPAAWERSLEGLADGFYRITWECGADVILTDLRASCGYLSFLDEVYLAQGLYYGLERSAPVTLYTAAPGLTLETWHAEALQALLVDGTPAAVVDEVARPVAVTLAEGVKEITLNDPDMIIGAPGSSFSPTADSLLIPVPRLQSVPLEQVDYILAAYSRPALTEEGYVQRLEFDLRGIPFDNHSFQLFFTAPGLAERGEELELVSIELELVKE